MVRTYTCRWLNMQGKYKPLSQPTKCVQCMDKRGVHSAYHVLCKKCGRDSGKCEKCRNDCDELVVPDLEDEMARKEKEEQDRILAGLCREREKRSFLRKIAKAAADEGDETEE